MSAININEDLPKTKESPHGRVECLDTVKHFLSSSTSFAIMEIDHDWFLGYNNEKGHQEGDRWLHRTWAAISKAIGSHGKLFRYGGDEYVVLVTGPALQNVAKIAEEIRLAIKELNERHNYPQDRIASVSIGLFVQVAQSTTVNAEEVFGKVRDATYEAKKAGRDRVVFIK